MATHGPVKSPMLPPPAKSITLYQNGNAFFGGKKFVINRRRVKNIDKFMEDATDVLHPSFGAVRSVYTPETGTRVRTLTSLEAGKSYVAGGKGGFKRLNKRYAKIGAPKPPPKPLQPRHYNIKSNRRRVQDRTIEDTRPLQLWLHVNGDMRSDPVSHLILSRILKQPWELIMNNISDKMCKRMGKAVQNIYTIDGSLVASLSDLKNNETYVVGGSELFRKRAYRKGKANSIKPRKRKPLPNIRSLTFKDNAIAEKPKSAESNFSYHSDRRKSHVRLPDLTAMDELDLTTVTPMPTERKVSLASTADPEKIELGPSPEPEIELETLSEHEDLDEIEQLESDDMSDAEDTSMSAEKEFAAEIEETGEEVEIVETVLVAEEIVAEVGDLEEEHIEATSEHLDLLEDLDDQNELIEDIPAVNEIEPPILEINEPVTGLDANGDGPRTEDTETEIVMGLDALSVGAEKLELPNSPTPLVAKSPTNDVEFPKSPSPRMAKSPAADELELPKSPYFAGSPVMVNSPTPEEGPLPISPIPRIHSRKSMTAKDSSEKDDAWNSTGELEGE